MQRVHEPAAVDILWHPAKRFHLRPFLGQAAGLADAAALLGVKKTAMSYWIDRLQSTGLIRAWTPTRRAGRHVPRYRAVADCFRLHLADAPHGSYEAVFDDTSERWQPQARRALARSIARQAPWLALSVSVQPGRGLASTLEPLGDDAPPDDSLYYWARLWLRPEERDRLRTELDALWDRYAALSDQAGKPCPVLLHLMTVPEHGS